LPPHSSGRGSWMIEKKIKYNIDALRKNIENCDKSIVLFQEAIQKEIRTKAELQALIAEIEKENQGL